MILPMAIAATAFALWSMAHLRRSLSIIPEARALVTSGPYTLIRHPLYLAEVSSALAVVLSWPALVPAGAFCVFVVLQLTRARFEERLLTRAFPGRYPAYMAVTPRLIPLLRPRGAAAAARLALAEQGATA
jgi:protein-S-isoprenylcysteine O-methyltransferase Ste14